jgi:hypothetical protein
MSTFTCARKQPEIRLGFEAGLAVHQNVLCCRCEGGSEASFRGPSRSQGRIVPGWGWSWTRPIRTVLWVTITSPRWSNCGTRKSGASDGDEMASDNDAAHLCEVVALVVNPSVGHRA